MKDEILIKYGKEEHLKQIVNGSIRFAPSQDYVLMEKELHNKGQGDLLDGKMKIKAERVRVHHPETHELLFVLPKCEFEVSIQDVNNMPVFCLSEYTDEDISTLDEKKYLDIKPEKIDCIKNDFKSATHALIIFEPEKFVNDISKIENTIIVSDKIHYYDYDMNPLQMYSFLSTGDEEYKVNEEMSVTYDDRYRHLLCKDIHFSLQQEYRFIVLNQLTNNAVFYPIFFSSCYAIVPIDELYDKVEIPNV